MEHIPLNPSVFVRFLQLFQTSFSSVFEKVIGIYTDAEIDGFQYYCSNGETIEMSEKTVDWISKSRNEKKEWQWFLIDSLPLSENIWSRNIKTEHPEDVKIKKENAPDLFYEFHANVLMIYVDTHVDQKKNLILLYPRNEQDFFFGDENIFIKNKEFVASTVRNIIIDLLTASNSSYKLIENQLACITHLERSLNEIKDAYKDFKNKKLIFAEFILKKMGEKQEIIILLSDDAKEIIKNFDGELYEFEPELLKAFSLACNGFPQPHSSVVLDDFHLSGLIKKEKNELHVEKNLPYITTQSSGQFSRTRSFLNRLEEAVKTTMDSGQKVIGKHVAENMKPFCITPPAISDSIKKHHDRILTLMTQEPNQWPLIRRYFRPIQNLVDNNTPLQKRSL